MLVSRFATVLFIKNKNPREALAEAASNFYKKKPKNLDLFTIFLGPYLFPIFPVWSYPIGAHGTGKLALGAG